MGSILVARRAGWNMAATAMVRRKAGTEAKIAGSLGWTPYRKLDRYRVRATAASSPAAVPAKARRRPWRSRAFLTRLGSAPRARRMPSSRVRCVVGEGMLLVVSGLVVGLIISVAAGRGLTSILYNVSAWDGPAFFGAVSILALVALIACCVPAQRATRVDPMVALRYE